MQKQKKPPLMRKTPVVKVKKIMLNLNDFFTEIKIYQNAGKIHADSNCPASTSMNIPEKWVNTLELLENYTKSNNAQTYCKCFKENTLEQKKALSNIHARPLIIVHNALKSLNYLEEKLNNFEKNDTAQLPLYMQHLLTAKYHAQASYYRPTSALEKNSEEKLEKFITDLQEKITEKQQENMQKIHQHLALITALYCEEYRSILKENTLDKKRKHTLLKTYLLKRLAGETHEKAKSELSCFMVTKNEDHPDKALLLDQLDEKARSINKTYQDDLVNTCLVTIKHDNSLTLYNLALRNVLCNIETFNQEPPADFIKENCTKENVINLISINYIKACTLHEKNYESLQSEALLAGNKNALTDLLTLPNNSKALKWSKRTKTLTTTEKELAATLYKDAEKNSLFDNPSHILKTIQITK